MSTPKAPSPAANRDLDRDFFEPEEREAAAVSAARYWIEHEQSGLRRRPEGLDGTTRSPESTRQAIPPPPSEERSGDADIPGPGVLPDIPDPAELAQTRSSTKTDPYPSRLNDSFSQHLLAPELEELTADAMVAALDHGSPERAARLRQDCLEYEQYRRETIERRPRNRGESESAPPRSSRYAAEIIEGLHSLFPDTDWLAEVREEFAHLEGAWTAFDRGLPGHDFPTKCRFEDDDWAASHTAPSELEDDPTTSEDAAARAEADALRAITALTEPAGSQDEMPAARESEPPEGLADQDHRACALQDHAGAAGFLERDENREEAREYFLRARDYLNERVSASQAHDEVLRNPFSRTPLRPELNPFTGIDGNAACARSDLSRAGDESACTGWDFACPDRNTSYAERELVDDLHPQEHQEPPPGLEHRSSTPQAAGGDGLISAISARASHEAQQTAYSRPSPRSLSSFIQEKLPLALLVVLLNACFMMLGYIYGTQSARAGVSNIGATEVRAIQAESDPPEVLSGAQQRASSVLTPGLAAYGHAVPTQHDAPIGGARAPADESGSQFGGDSVSARGLAPIPVVAYEDLPLLETVEPPSRSADREDRDVARKPGQPIPVVSYYDLPIAPRGPRSERSPH